MLSPYLEQSLNIFERILILGPKKPFLLKAAVNKTAVAKSIIELAVNALQNQSLQLTPHSKSQLAQHRKVIAQLSTKTGPLKDKKRLLKKPRGVKAAFVLIKELLPYITET